MTYFAASCDDPETNKRFAESLELNYPILSDPSRETALAYGLVSSKQGNAARRTFYIGKDGAILHIDSAVKAGQHGKDVAVMLESLKVEKK